MPSITFKIWWIKLKFLGRNNFRTELLFPCGDFHWSHTFPPIWNIQIKINSCQDNRTWLLKGGLCAALSNSVPVLMMACTGPEGCHRNCDSWALFPCQVQDEFSHTHQEKKKGGLWGLKERGTRKWQDWEKDCVSFVQNLDHVYIIYIYTHTYTQIYSMKTGLLCGSKYNVFHNDVKITERSWNSLFPNLTKNNNDCHPYLFWNYTNKILCRL